MNPKDIKKLKHREYMRVYRFENKEKVRLAQQKYREKNKPKVYNTKREWYLKNKSRILLKNKDRYNQLKSNQDYKDQKRNWNLSNIDKVRQYSRIWRSKNPAYLRKKANERNKLKRLATPKWSNLSKIKQLQNEARQLTKQTGIKYCIDHIIPLNNKLVCGLNVPENIQIITVEQNSRKNNRFEP